MKLIIPDEISENFFALLDLAQANFTEDEVRKFSEEERECLRFVESIVSEFGSLSQRFETDEEKKTASRNLSFLLR